MEVRTLIKRGGDHHVYCEDDLFTFNDGDLYIGAVFDGCSTGIKSHFASALYSKILRRSCSVHDFEYASLKAISQNIVYDIRDGIVRAKNLLFLDEMELLSTMILAVVKDNKAFVTVSGDGCIKYDEQIVIIESEDNAPNYLAHYLDNYARGTASLKEYEFSFNDSLSICSDGIFSFADQNRENMDLKIIQSLLEDRTLLKSEAMLARKYNLLLREGLTHYDDLSIVRFIV
jgi:hypothetical protein